MTTSLHMAHSSQLGISQVATIALAFARFFSKLQNPAHFAPELPPELKFCHHRMPLSLVTGNVFSLPCSRVDISEALLGTDSPGSSAVPVSRGRRAFPAAKAIVTARTAKRPIAGATLPGLASPL